MSITTVVLATGALLLGVALGWLLARNRSQSERARLRTELAHVRSNADEKLNLLRQEKQQLSEEFQRLSDDALKQNRDEFLRMAGEQLSGAQQHVNADLQQRRDAVEALVKPLGEQLDKVTNQVQSLERSRADAYAELRTQVQAMGRNSEQLRAETQQLVAALRAPQVRGRWGELQLRRVVEAAGMLEHVDFTEQASADTDDGKLRPDMLVKLAGGKRIVVDAKVSFNGFLEAQHAEDEATHRDRLSAHTRHIREHVDSLAAKQYWEQFAPAPEFVVMFVPSEVFITAAAEHDPTIYEYAFERDVVIATPATLVALLRTVGYTWRQETLAQNAQQVLNLGRELHSRLSTLGGHVSKLGNQLNKAVTAYNSTVSSLESRVLVTARRMADLKVVDSDLDTVSQVDTAARQTQAPELQAATDERLVAIDETESTG